VWVLLRNKGGDMIRLDGKRALITGGSRGIGKATALLFAEAGCDVAVNYLNQKNAAEEVKSAVEKIKKKCLIVKADVRNKKEVKRAVDFIVKEWERIDILVNSAGVWTYGEMGSMEARIWRETMEINLDGVFHVCNAVIPYMKMNEGGEIINVSSTAGVRGEAFHSHYAASKGALIALTKSLAVELSTFNIRVNCVAPGWVDTDMCADVFRDKKFKMKVKNSIPLKRIPSPKDIAGPIMFLASDLARHITGEILNVNGGSVLCG
jgi:3-oxoacyl-[acyl-carrier protein] reductase